MKTNNPETEERMRALESLASDAISEAYRLRRLWEFSAAMISANEKKINPRGRDEERLLALAKSADHGMAWAGTTDGWIDSSTGITKNRSEHGVRSKPNVLAYYVHGGHLYAPDDVVFEDDEDYVPLIRLSDYEARMAVLFDGHAVYSAMTDKAKQHTSPESVAAVLDAVVKLMKEVSNDDQ